MSRVNDEAICVFQPCCYDLYKFCVKKKKNSEHGIPSSGNLFSKHDIENNKSFSDDCRQLEFRARQTVNGRRLLNHVILITDVMSQDLCELSCYTEANCFSYNFMIGSVTGKHKCELNNSTHEGHENELEKNSNYVYRGAEVKYRYGFQ